MHESDGLRAACYGWNVVAPVRQRFDFEAYVLLEEDSPIKHEFLGGVVWAMAGGSPEHAGIAANVSRLLGNQLHGRKCRVFTSDLRVRVKATGLATYPDVTIVCGSLELDPEDPKQHTVTNPIVIAEVLSPSTEDYDRGEKLEHYRQIPSLEMVLLVAHDARRVDVWRRDGTGWTSESIGDGGTVDVSALGCQLDVAEVFRDPLT